MKTCLTKQEGIQIKYQLALQGYSIDKVAKRVGCHGTTVSQFLNGRNRSEGAESTLAEILGFKDFDALWEVAKQETAA